MKTILILLFQTLVVCVYASGLSISEPIIYIDENESYAVLNVSWENGWNNERNNDAVWLFFKLLRGENGYRHAKVNAEGHLINTLDPAQEVNIGYTVPADGTGIFIYPQSAFRGNINLSVKIVLDTESARNRNTRNALFKAYAIEMVRIPEGGFFLGDRDTSALKRGSFYRSDANGDYDGLYELRAEAQEVKIAPEEGSLYYQAPRGYEGDQKGTIPAAFPKGVEEFYIMKYEPTQGQYVDFLNSLSEQQSHNRANFGGKNYYRERGSIEIKNGVYNAGYPNATCNFMSWDDAMAYADWAGLSPMTEFEFTKASRGTERPEDGWDFPWGSNSKLGIQRSISKNGELIMLNNWEESRLTDETKEVFAGSYYWVMDMAGSLWERVITVGDEKGRKFEGTHGDGYLSDYGFATNEDWPKGIEETGGFGFRGGGFYTFGRYYHDFNPYSPISFRPYGGWSGGSRKNAYGARFVKRVE